MNWRSTHDDAFDGVRVLVTGAAGFIGSHLVEALVSLGAKVTAIDDLSGGDWANLNGFDEQVECVTASILDRDALATAVKDCRYVFHQAALGSVPRSLEEPERFVQVNVLGTTRVLEAARAAGARRVMFASSSSVYGNPPDGAAPKREDMPLMPLSPYAATKAAGEHLMAAWSSGYGFDTAPLRYFNVFGPRQNANSAYAAVIAAFAKAMHAGKPGTIYGDGSQSRDFTFVANVVHANLLAARHEKPLAGQPMNAACGGRITVLALHETMAKIFGMPDVPPTLAEPRAGEVLHSLADNGRAAQTIGYQPLIDFEQGLAQTIDWYRGHLSQ